MVALSTDSGPVLSAAANVSSDAASGLYVAPFVAALDTSGTATLTAVQLQELAVTIANVQRTFKLNLTLAQTAAFLNSFTVSKSGADLKVELDKPAFEAFMDVVIQDAMDEEAAAIAADPANGSKGRAIKPAGNVELWLAHGLKNTLVDYILRTLKVSAVVDTAVVIVNDVVDPATTGTASKSMSAGLAPPNATNSDILETIYLQIAQDTLNLYKDANNIPTTNALPLKGGDKMVFVFDTAAMNVSAVVTESQSKANVSAPGANVGANATAADVAGNYNQAGAGSIVLTDTYRVAFEVTMAGAGAIALADTVPEGILASETAENVLRRVKPAYWNFVPA
jgi:hypothetical protein